MSVCGAGSQRCVLSGEVCAKEVPRRSGQNHRIAEYLKLEGTHKDYKYQLRASRRATQNANPMSEGSIQTILEFCQFEVGSLFL